jgi:hypothetical protein
MTVAPFLVVRPITPHGPPLAVAELNTLFDPASRGEKIDFSHCNHAPISRFFANPF